MPTLPTATDPAPGDWSYGSAVWLLTRNPRLERWVQRIPGAWTPDEDDLHPYDPYGLLEAIEAFDAGAEQHPGADAYGVLSGGERRGLRMLAFFAGPVKLSISELGGFDDLGELLVSDWTTAILAHHGIRPR